MANYWRIVNKVILNSDILLLVLDARMPELTRHREIEMKIRQKAKKILYVLNKCDLVPKSEIEKAKKELQPCVFVSSKEKLGGTILLKKILELSKGQECYVGVLGYPNVGKSSIINMLKGKKAASVSPHAGHTHGIQFVRARRKLKLIDTPGVLPFGEKDILKQVIIGSKNPEHLKEPDFFAMEIISKYSELFEKYYNLKYNGDASEFLETLASKKNVLIRGGKPDLPRMARQLLYDWQRGKLHKLLLDG